MCWQLFGCFGGIVRQLLPGSWREASYEEYKYLYSDLVSNPIRFFWGEGGEGEDRITFFSHLSSVLYLSNNFFKSYLLYFIFLLVVYSSHPASCVVTDMLARDLQKLETGS